MFGVEYIYVKNVLDRPNEVCIDNLVPDDHGNRVLFYNDSYDNMERVDCYLAYLSSA